jgi:Fe-S cluster biogenesis protein NfuA
VLAAFFLNMHYFKAVSVFSIKNTDCIALTLEDGRKWDDSLGEKSTIHSFLEYLVMKNYKDMKVVIGRDENVDLEDLKRNMESFVRLHPLQKIVKRDEGSLAFDNFDPATGTLTLQFGGKCASSTTCVGSQISSRNWITRDTRIEFPNHVRQIKFS